MICSPSRADCARFKAEWRIYDVYAGEIGNVVNLCPTWVEIQWPRNPSPVSVSFESIATAGHYCLI